MKTKSKDEKVNELRHEYDLAALLKKGMRGKYAKRYEQRTKLVLLSPDIYNMINIRQFVIGFTVLIFGLVFYILFRDQTYFTQKLNIENVQLPYNAGGVIWNSFPSFVHVFSFSMITASLIKDSKFMYFIVCTIWLIINCIFELSQKYKAFALGITPSWFESIPFLENTKNFFLNGTFDVMDIFSIFAGAITAFYVLTITAKRRSKE